MDKKQITLPNPILDSEEFKAMELLQERYVKLMQPNALLKAGEKVVSLVPDKIKEVSKNAGTIVRQQELVRQAMEYAVIGFKKLEEIAAKVTISEKTILKKANKISDKQEISSLEEMCLVRAYDISTIVNSYKTSNILIATAEGASTGAMGFAGIVPNFVLSTFIYFRAVQSIAMHYGYDVKKSAAEMEIASSVFISALDPKQDAANNELTAMIGKFMVFTETTAVKQASRKTWTEMAKHGGLGLMVTQIRALANKAAQKALAEVGQKGLEQSVLKGILEQLGKKASLKNTGRAMPVLGGIFGAFFDTAQMSKIVDYADVFYNKRFIEEKEARINSLYHLEEEPPFIDILDDCVEIIEE